MCRKLILTLAILLGFFMTTGCSASTIDVKFSVRDAAGQPIPYVTVWQFVHKPDSSDPAIEMAMPDAWRIANRYRDDLEMVIWGHQLVPKLYPAKMGDEAGHYVEKLDYEKIKGRGQLRPDPLNFGYVFLKRGYLPGKAEFRVSLNENRVSADIVLRPDPDDPPDSAPNNTEYMREFERLRYVLSDDEKLRVVSEKQQAYFDSLWQRFEDCAQQALAAGDDRTAARIYARMQYFPSVIFIRGKPAGFSMSDPRKPRFLTQAEKAYALDTDIPYMQMGALRRKFQRVHEKMEQERRGLFHWKKASPQEMEYFRKLMAEELRLLQKYGDRLWPVQYIFRAYHHLAMGEYEEAWEWVDRAEKIEPRYYDYNLDRKEIILSMRREKRQVPFGWQRRIEGQD